MKLYKRCIRKNEDDWYSVNRLYRRYSNEMKYRKKKQKRSLYNWNYVEHIAGEKRYYTRAYPNKHKNVSYATYYKRYCNKRIRLNKNRECIGNNNTYRKRYEYKWIID